jgi:hypothetical protein
MLVPSEKTGEPSVEKIAKLICIIKIIISKLENQNPPITFTLAARLKDEACNEINNVANPRALSGSEEAFFSAKTPKDELIKTNKNTPLDKFRKALTSLEQLINGPAGSLNQRDLKNMFTKANKLLRDQGYENLPADFDNEVIEKAKFLLEARNNYQHNLSSSNTSVIPKELFANIFKYVPLDQLPQVSLVCHTWSNYAHTNAHWKIRLQRDFGLSVDKCDSITSPQKVYRRLHLLRKPIKTVARISDVHERSNRTILFNSLNELLVFINKDCFELSDYPEVFYPYSSSALEAQFLKNFQQYSHIWRRFLLENAIALGNFEFIRFLVQKDKSLISKISLAQAYIAGDLQLIDYLSKGGVDREDLVWKMFSKDLRAVASYVEKHTQDFLDNLLIEFLPSAIEDNKPKIIEYLCGSYLALFKSKCNRYQWDDFTKECLNAAINSNLSTQKMLLGCLNLSIKDLPDDILHYWITTPDIKKMLWLANENGISVVNLANELLPIASWQDINYTRKPELFQLFSVFVECLRVITWEQMAPKMSELLYVLFEINNEVYPINSATLDPQFLFYFRCLFSIEADNSQLLHILLLNDNLAWVGDDLLTALCLQSQGRKKYRCLELLLNHYSGISLCQQMLQSAFCGSDSTFFMMVKAAPLYSKKLSNEITLSILLTHNYSYDYSAPPISLRFLKFIFATFKLQLPTDWESRLRAPLPSHIRDFIKEQVLEQQPFTTVMDVRASFDAIAGGGK